MKKNVLFSVVLIVIGVLLFMLRTTGMTGHIVLAAAGVILLGIYTAMTIKEWGFRALEIIMRVFYLIALITGVIIMNVHGIMILAVLHKISAALFVIMTVVLLVLKMFRKR